MEAKYEKEIADHVASIQAEIEAAKKDKNRRTELLKELKAYRREMEEKIAHESRTLLKERFDYPIFLYEAEKVGITATGEADQNELYPNTDIPSGIEKTCVELYRKFRQDPKKFF